MSPSTSTELWAAIDVSQARRRVVLDVLVISTGANAVPPNEVAAEQVQDWISAVLDKYTDAGPQPPEAGPAWLVMVEGAEVFEP